MNKFYHLILDIHTHTHSMTYVMGINIEPYWKIKFRKKQEEKREHRWLYLLEQQKELASKFTPQYLPSMIF